MGIEPTSEAWEACCRQPKTHKLAAFCRFSKFSNGFQLEQRESRSGFESRLNWRKYLGQRCKHADSDLIEIGLARQRDGQTRNSLCASKEDSILSETRWPAPSLCDGSVD